MTLGSTHPNPVEKRVIDASSLIGAGSDLFVVRVEIYQRCLIPETRISDLKDTVGRRHHGYFAEKGSTRHRSGSTAGTLPGGAAPFPSGFAYGVIEAI
jgi:hypothetical protein